MMAKMGRCITTLFLTVIMIVFFAIGSEAVLNIANYRAAKVLDTSSSLEGPKRTGQEDSYGWFNFYPFKTEPETYGNRDESWINILGFASVQELCTWFYGDEPDFGDEEEEVCTDFSDPYSIYKCLSYLLYTTAVTSWQFLAPVIYTNIEEIFCCSAVSAIVYRIMGIFRTRKSRHRCEEIVPVTEIAISKKLFNDKDWKLNQKRAKQRIFTLYIRFKKRKKLFQKKLQNAINLQPSLKIDLKAELIQTKSDLKHLNKLLFELNKKIKPSKQIYTDDCICNVNKIKKQMQVIFRNLTKGVVGENICDPSLKSDFNTEMEEEFLSESVCKTSDKSHAFDSNENQCSELDRQNTPDVHVNCETEKLDNELEIPDEHNDCETQIEEQGKCETENTFSTQEYSESCDTDFKALDFLALPEIDSQSSELVVQNVSVQTKASGSTEELLEDSCDTKPFSINDSDSHDLDEFVLSSETEDFAITDAMSNPKDGDDGDIEIIEPDIASTKIYVEDKQNTTEEVRKLCTKENVEEEEDFCLIARTYTNILTEFCSLKNAVSSWDDKVQKLQDYCKELDVDAIDLQNLYQFLLVAESGNCDKNVVDSDQNVTVKNNVKKVETESEEATTKVNENAENGFSLISQTYTNILSEFASLKNAVSLWDDRVQKLQNHCKEFKDTNFTAACGEVDAFNQKIDMSQWNEKITKLKEAYRNKNGEMLKSLQAENGEKLPVKKPQNKDKSWSTEKSWKRNISPTSELSNKPLPRNIASCSHIYKRTFSEKYQCCKDIEGEEIQLVSDDDTISEKSTSANPKLQEFTDVYQSGKGDTSAFEKLVSYFEAFDESKQLENNDSDSTLVEFTGGENESKNNKKLFGKTDDYNHTKFEKVTSKTKKSPTRVVAYADSINPHNSYSYNFQRNKMLKKKDLMYSDNSKPLQSPKWSMYLDQISKHDIHSFPCVENFSGHVCDYIAQNKYEEFKYVKTSYNKILTELDEMKNVMSVWGEQKPGNKQESDSNSDYNRNISFDNDKSIQTEWESSSKSSYTDNSIFENLGNKNQSFMIEKNDLLQTSFKSNDEIATESYADVKNDSVSDKEEALQGEDVLNEDLFSNNHTDFQTKSESGGEESILPSSSSNEELSANSHVDITQESSIISLVKSISGEQIHNFVQSEPADNNKIDDPDDNQSEDVFIYSYEKHNDFSRDIDFLNNDDKIRQIGSDVDQEYTIADSVKVESSSSTSSVDISSTNFDGKEILLQNEITEKYDRNIDFIPQNAENNLKLNENLISEIDAPCQFSELEAVFQTSSDFEYDQFQEKCQDSELFENTVDNFESFNNTKEEFQYDNSMSDEPKAHICKSNSYTSNLQLPTVLKHVTDVKALQKRNEFLGVDDPLTNFKEILYLRGANNNFAPKRLPKRENCISARGIESLGPSKEEEFNIIKSSYNEILTELFDIKSDITNLDDKLVRLKHEYSEEFESAKPSSCRRDTDQQNQTIYPEKKQSLVTSDKAIQNNNHESVLHGKNLKRKNKSTSQIEYDARSGAELSHVVSDQTISNEPVDLDQCFQKISSYSPIPLGELSKPANERSAFSNKIIQHKLHYLQSMLAKAKEIKTNHIQLNETVTPRTNAIPDQFINSYQSSSDTLINPESPTHQQKISSTLLQHKMDYYEDMLNLYRENDIDTSVCLQQSVRERYLSSRLPFRSESTCSASRKSDISTSSYYEVYSDQHSKNDPYSPTRRGSYLKMYQKKKQIPQSKQAFLVPSLLKRYPNARNN